MYMGNTNWAWWVIKQEQEKDRERETRVRESEREISSWVGVIGGSRRCWMGRGVNTDKTGGCIQNSQGINKIKGWGRLQHTLCK